MVASFSARGPNHVSPDILKVPFLISIYTHWGLFFITTSFTLQPDLVAPGVEILAGWSPVSPPSEFESDNRTLQFNILSGTSMSCPHVSGAAAYVKSFNPKWSPSAIQSALMTTGNTSLLI